MMLSVCGFLKSIMFLLIDFVPFFRPSFTQKIKFRGLGFLRWMAPRGNTSIFISLYFPEFSKWPFISLRDPGSTSIYVTDSSCWFISPQNLNPVEYFQDVDPAL